MRIPKRHFIALLVSILLFFFLLRWWETLKHLLFRAEAPQQSHPRIENVFTEKGRMLVGLAQGRDVPGLVEQALNLIGGWDRIQVHGKTVLVKPKVVSGNPPPATTSPQVVGAVVRGLYEHGASHVWVGDMSAMTALPTRRNMEKTGILQAAETAGAEILCFEDHQWVEVPLATTRLLDRIYVSECVFKADRVVNLPDLKTHRSAAYSIALKNFVGATHGRQRPYFIDRLHWEEFVAERNLGWNPDIHIVDATTSMIAGGPWKEESAQTGLAIASGDPVAADLVGLGVIKSCGQWSPVVHKNTWDQRQIKKATKLGVGVASPRELTVLHTSQEREHPDFERLVRAIHGYLNERA